MVGEHVDPRMKEEMSAIVKAKHPGVAYIMGHSYVFKKFAIDLAYNFLWRCRRRLPDSPWRPERGFEVPVCRRPAGAGIAPVVIHRGVALCCYASVSIWWDREKGTMSCLSYAVFFKIYTRLCVPMDKVSLIKAFY
jgi:hypothetical protein